LNGLLGHPDPLFNETERNLNHCMPTHKKKKREREEKKKKEKEYVQMNMSNIVTRLLEERDMQSAYSGSHPFGFQNKQPKERHQVQLEISSL
jgi:hypothetical protein